jgi:gluconokinase
MVIVMMGVTGTGKTRVGRLLASQLGWAFYDADDYHSRTSIEKMRAGALLTDEDRAPWLARLHDLVAACVERGENVVLACSALKAAYRDRLRVDAQQVVFVYLNGDPALIAARLAARRGHYMPASLLASQLAILEQPTEGVRVDIAATPETIVRRVRQALRL